MITLKQRYDMCRIPIFKKRENNIKKYDKKLKKICDVKIKSYRNGDLSLKESNIDLNLIENKQYIKKVENLINKRSC